MDFQYATETFKPAVDKSREKPKSEKKVWYNDGKYYYKDEQGVMWVSQNGETWEVQK